MSTSLKVSDLDSVLIEYDKVLVAGIDVDGVLRGKIMAKSKFISAVTSGFGFCSVIFGWDILDRTYAKELAISNIANGYKDLQAEIDLSSFRELPPIGQAPRQAFFFVSFFDPETKKRLSVCPRGTLRSVIDKYAEYSMLPMGGAEFEYFNYAETPDTAAEKNFTGLKPMTTGMHGYSLLRPALNARYFFNLFDCCKEAGIDLEGHHTETGPGVYESAIEYGPASRTADNAILFKYISKLVGYENNVLPTFMAKPYVDQPGCSGHIHISLRDSTTGANLFAVDPEFIENGRPDAYCEDTKRISPLAEHFLAGLLAGLPDVIPCLLPNVNSYKRLVESFWAPITVSYAYESRLASVRIISPPIGEPKSTRLEVRIPGADMNAHYAYAAILACGFYGIENKLSLSFPPINTAHLTSPDAPAGSLPKFERLPKTLYEAAVRMAAKDSVARKVLGDDFVDHFAETRFMEWDQYAQAVTDWELKRYFELA